ncbi:MAG: anaerobic ribonucleoside-triphosphate reductase activating protein [Bacilli bacterium]|nr:anaerobic ribonucleoside-triphosphate reductase activating protein [Bacilli bacterium]
MRYNKIRKMDIANGPGVRVSVFFQGCEFHCKGCFNKDTWDFCGGKEFTDETIDKILELCAPDYIVGLSMLGGEPMHPKNIEGTTKLAKAFKEKYPEKSLWSWTGFTFEGLKDKEVMNYLDVLIDGQFKEELFSPKLRWRGSSNQRVIDIKKTLKKNEIVLFKDEEY